MNETCHEFVLKPLPTELLKFKLDFSASHQLTFARYDRTWKLDGRPLDRKYSVRVAATHHNHLSELNATEKSMSTVRYSILPCVEWQSPPFQS